MNFHLELEKIEAKKWAKARAENYGLTNAEMREAQRNMRQHDEEGIAELLKALVQEIEAEDVGVVTVQNVKQQIEYFLNWYYDGSFNALATSRSIADLVNEFTFSLMFYPISSASVNERTTEVVLSEILYHLSEFERHGSFNDDALGVTADFEEDEDDED
jgi:hypothetical protein